MSAQLQVTGEAKIRDIQGPVVANDGVITALDGAASQYVRGDGTLADFPTSSGGGSSVSYYLNSSVSQGTIGGVAYRELSKDPIIGTGTDIAISSNGYVASYITDANDPDVTIVPGGNFNCEFYFSVNNNTGNPFTYAELYKYDGTTFTLLGSSVGVPEYINQGTIIAPYYFAIPVPTSSLALTDRLAIRIYVNVDGRTVTLHTENSHLCQVVTTLSKGMVSLNNLTDQSQFLTTGTSGTNFAIASSGDTHTFNLPVASATNTGKLSNTDWSTFNNKQNALTNPITGLGASGNVAYFDSASSITSENSFNYDASTNRLGVNTTVPNATIGANAGLDSGYSLLLKNDNANYNGIGFATTSTYGNVIGTEKLGTAPARNLTLLNQSGYISITENGNLGVNILNPNAGIDIYSSTASSLWLHTATSGITGTDGVRLSLFSSNNAVLRNFDGSLSMSSEGDFYVITLGAENIRVNSVDGFVGIGNPTTLTSLLTVNGAITQSSVLSSLLKTNASGTLVAAVAGTDYVVPSALSGYVPTSRTLTINGTAYDLSADRSWTVGTMGGSGVSGRVAYYDGTNSITSEGGFIYDASTNRLGVNTSVPNATIGGDAALDSGYGLLIKTGASNYNGIGIAIDSTYGNLISTEKLGTASARNLTLLNQSGFVSLRENGNFGVNTLNPAVSGTGIDVYSSTSTGIRFHTANSGLTVSDGAGINFSAANNLGITNYEAGTIDIVTNGNSGVFIASTGLVGINGATPSVALTVNGAISQTSVTSSLLKTDSSGLLVAAVAGTDYVIPSALSGYVPTSRTLTINGTSYDLSANRSWSVGTTTGSGTTNYLPKFTGSTSIGDSAITDNGTTVTLISRTLTATSGSFITNDNNFLFNVELKNTNAGTQALTGLGLADLSGTRKGQVLWIPSNYVTTSLQNSFLVSSVTNIPLILCADATGAATPNIKFQSGATDKMTLFGSTGNLSIGNSTDSGNKLHITAIAPILAIESSTTGNVFLRMLQAGTIVSSLFYNNATSTLTLSNNNAGIQFNTSGASPALTLASTGAATFSSSITGKSYSVVGTNGYSGQIIQQGDIFGTAATNLLIQSSTGNGIGFLTNGGTTFNMFINPSGNVGIGTSSPTDYGSSYRTLEFNAPSFPVFNMSCGGTRQFQIVASSTESLIATVNATPLLFYTNSAERMRITSGGQVIIGNSSSLYTNTKLAVCQTSANMTAEIRSAWAGDISTSALIVIKQDNDNSTSQVFQRFANASGGNANGQINGNGAAQVAFGSWSDRRLKENIEDLPSQLQNILALRPVEFDYKNGSGHQIGFIAQEMQEVYSDAVGEDSDGFLTITGWSKTEARLVKAIQEQQAQIEELSNKIVALQSK